MHDEPLYVVHPREIAAGIRNTDAMRRQLAEDPKRATDTLEVTHRMDRRLFLNAKAQGEHPDRDESYIKDMVRRGCVIEVKPQGKTGVSLAQVDSYARRLNRFGRIKETIHFDKAGNRTVVSYRKAG